MRPLGIKVLHAYVVFVFLLSQWNDEFSDSLGSLVYLLQVNFPNF